jgi:hypothetical protein
MGLALELVNASELAGQDYLLIAVPGAVVLAALSLGVYALKKRRERDRRGD